MGNYVYILRCGDGSLYTGATVDLVHRLEVPSRGTGAKYTRSQLPVELAYQDQRVDWHAALRREAAIKRSEAGAHRRICKCGSKKRAPVRALFLCAGTRFEMDDAV